MRFASSGRPSPRAARIAVEEKSPLASETSGAALQGWAKTIYGKLTGDTSSAGGTLVITLSNAERGTILLNGEEKGNITNGSGAVDAMKLAELQKLDAGFRWSPDGGKTFPFRGTGVRIPTLEEVFDRFPALRMNVEIKSPPGAAAAKLLCERIRAQHMSDLVLVASMSDEAIEFWKKRRPDQADRIGHLNRLGTQVGSWLFD